MTSRFPTRDDAYLDRIIASRFKGKYMSNAKWVRLLTQLTAEETPVPQCREKLIWEEGSPVRELLLANKRYAFDFYDSAVEAMITGNPRGWYAYKEIEWLDFPAHTAAGPQDLARIAGMLAGVGSWSSGSQRKTFACGLTAKRGRSRRPV